MDDKTDYRSLDPGIWGFTGRPCSRTPSMNARIANAETDAPIVDLWLRGRPPTTRRAYKADYRVLVDFTGKALHATGAEDLFRFAVEVPGAPATRARRIAAVKSLFGFAFRAGFLQQDPARTLRVPASPRNVTERVLTEPELADLVKEARPGRDQALLRTLYIAGIRISEALGLRWRDVGRRWLSIKGKGSRPRTVVVPPQLILELEALRSKCSPDEGFVFEGREGHALSVSQARRVVQTAAVEGLGRSVCPHDLRHTHACHAVDHGVPLHVLQASLGHASLSTTSLYLHVRPTQGSSQYLSLGT